MQSDDQIILFAPEENTHRPSSQINVITGLVVSTILKTISQWERIIPYEMEIKFIFQTTNQIMSQEYSNITKNPPTKWIVHHQKSLNFSSTKWWLDDRKATDENPQPPPPFPPPSRHCPPTRCLARSPWEKKKRNIDGGKAWQGPSEPIWMVAMDIMYIYIKW